MTAGRKKNIVFIINPISGVRKKHRIEEIISREIDHSKYESHFLFTEYAGHGAALAATAVASGAEIVVAVGGDGSVNEVAGQLVGTQVSLGIVPMGSGNGLANHLNIPLSPPKAVQILNQSHSQQIDTAAVNGLFFISIAGIGFDATIARKFAGSRKRGFWTYLRLILREFVTYQVRPYKLNIDGQDISRDALFISFANSDQYGYKTKIAPEASVDDGFLDVCIVGKPPIYRMPLMAYLLFTNQIGKLKDVEIVKAKVIKIFCTEEKTVNLDGDPKSITGNLEVAINASSLNVIIP